jgi:hypothetical protein
VPSQQHQTVMKIIYSDESQRQYTLHVTSSTNLRK